MVSSVVDCTLYEWMDIVGQSLVGYDVIFIRGDAVVLSIPISLNFQSSVDVLNISLVHQRFNAFFLKFLRHLVVPPYHPELSYISREVLHSIAF